MSNDPPPARLVPEELIADARRVHRRRTNFTFVTQPYEPGRGPLSYGNAQVQAKLLNDLAEEWVKAALAAKRLALWLGATDESE